MLSHSNHSIPTKIRILKYFCCYQFVKPFFSQWISPKRCSHFQYYFYDTDDDVSFEVNSDESFKEISSNLHSDTKTLPLSVPLTKKKKKKKKKRWFKLYGFYFRRIS